MIILIKTGFCTGDPVCVPASPVSVPASPVSVPARPRFCTYETVVVAELQRIMEPANSKVNNVYKNSKQGKCCCLLASLRG